MVRLGLQRHLPWNKQPPVPQGRQAESQTSNALGDSSIAETPTIPKSFGSRIEAEHNGKGPFGSFARPQTVHRFALSTKDDALWDPGCHVQLRRVGAEVEDTTLTTRSAKF